MYKKIVWIGQSSYAYYYHNFKIEGKVRNVCLGPDPQRAKTLLEKIRGGRRRGKNLHDVVKRCRKAQILG